MYAQQLGRYRSKIPQQCNTDLPGRDQVFIPFEERNLQIETSEFSENHSLDSTTRVPARRGWGGGVASFAFVNAKRNTIPILSSQL